MAVRFGVCSLVVMLTTGCLGAKSGHVPVPPVTAGPKRVVTAYVAALNAHDRRTARTLLTPAHEKLVESEVDGWFTNLRSITHLHVYRPKVEHSDAWPMRAIVGTKFVLNQHKETSMPNGPTVWAYYLVRNSPKQRWLIYDEGLG